MHTSNLFIGSVEQLEKIAKDWAAQFNPADVFWLVAKTPDAAGVIPFSKGGIIRVEETLEFMERAYLAPVGERKLMIIMGAEQMTIPAQNKTLKVIEDAPGSTIFLLLATNLQPVLNTIRSRCVTKFLTTPSPADAGATPSKEGELLPREIKETLKKLFNIEFDEKALSGQQQYAILSTLAKFNRNVAANCNAANHMDLLIMEIMKYAKNS